MRSLVPAATVRPQRALAREVAGLLAIKLIALTIIYFAFFAQPPRQPDMAAHVLAASAQH